MRMTLRSLFKRNGAGGVQALFNQRHISYSFNTRVAIRKACDVLGLRPDDEILVPSWNCGSELDPLRHAGLKLSFYQIDQHAQIDVESVANRITPRTKAIYLTHYFGFLHPSLADIRKLCDDHDLVLIEDCALSLLSGLVPAAGTTGDVAVFCFYKFFPTLAGGALVINNDRFINHSLFDRPAPFKLTAKPILRASLDKVIDTKWMRVYRSWKREQKDNKNTLDLDIPDMPDHYYFDPKLENTRISLLTTLALRSFDIEDTITTRRANYMTYLELLSSVPGITPLFESLDDQTCPYSMPVLTNHRDTLAKSLIAQGVNATPWWAGYNRYLNWDEFPDARYLKDNILSLPVHQSLSQFDIRQIVELLSSISRNIS